MRPGHRAVKANAANLRVARLDCELERQKTLGAADAIPYEAYVAVGAVQNLLR